MNKQHSIFLMAFIHHDVKTRGEYAKWIYLWGQNLWQEVTSTATMSYQARFKFGVYGVPNLLHWHVTFARPPLRGPRG